MAKRLVGYRVDGGELAPRAYAIYEDVPESMGDNMTELSARNDLVASLRAVDHTSVEDCFLQSPLFERAAKEIERLQRTLSACDECARRGIDPDEICADGGVTAEMVVAKEMRECCDLAAQSHCPECPAKTAPYEQCPKCGGDCSAANPPVFDCPLTPWQAPAPCGGRTDRRLQVMTCPRVTLEMEEAGREWARSHDPSTFAEIFEAMWNAQRNVARS